MNMEIKNLKKERKRIKKAVKKKENIILFGDGDLDGATAVLIVEESINNIILKDDSPVKTKFILALLNSKLINWFYTIQFTNESNLTVNLSKTYLSQIPISLPKKEDAFISLVDEILSVKKENNLADTQELESQIDQLVYKLYNLTAEEIAIIENN